MKSKKIVISSHVVYIGDKDVFGPATAVSEYLKVNKISHTYIRHSLYQSKPSEVLSFSSKKQHKSTFRLPGLLPGPLRFPFETISVINYLTKNKTDLFIAADPVNAFGAILGKKFGLVKVVVFYTADYAVKRFENKIFNNIYHSLDRYAVKNADYVWNVSSRIRQVRNGLHVPEERNILVPNTPLVKQFTKFRTKKQIPNSLILMANFTVAIDYKTILQTVKDLKKKYRNIVIGFIGKGDLEDQVRALVKQYKIEDNIQFLGFMDHDNALQTAAKYKIGLAPYANLWSWTEFGDSLKAREYLALGLPVIISDNVSTADDIVTYKAGFSISMSKANLYKAIDRLLGNSDQYTTMKKNALKLARDFDLEQILDEQLKDKLLI